MKFRTKMTAVHSEGNWLEADLEKYKIIFCLSFSIGEFCSNCGDFKPETFSSDLSECAWNSIAAAQKWFTKENDDSYKCFICDKKVEEDDITDNLKKTVLTDTELSKLKTGITTHLKTHTMY